MSVTRDFNSFITLDKVKILKKIIDKGGMMGYVAKLYIADDKKAHQFIIECAEQCHNQNAVTLWGNGLTREIIKYCNATNK